MPGRKGPALFLSSRASWAYTRTIRGALDTRRTDPRSPPTRGVVDIIRSLLIKIEFITGCKQNLTRKNCAVSLIPKENVLGENMQDVHPTFGAQCPCGLHKVCARTS